MQVAAIPSVMMRAQNSTSKPKNAAVQAALDHIANSTRLTPAEKKSFTQLLANLDDASANDPQLMLKIMMLIAFTESGRDRDFDKASSQAKVEAQYDQSRSADLVV